MGHFLFEQLRFVRRATLHAVKDVNEEQADIIPKGFNNSIRWNLGHIYFIQEQLVFQLAGEPMQLPDGFIEFFGMGTRPSDWTVQPPGLPEIVQLLKEQPGRVKERLENRLEDAVVHPFKLPGLELKTINEVLSFCLFHEGMHYQLIKTVKSQIKNEDMPPVSM